MQLVSTASALTEATLTLNELELYSRLEQVQNSLSKNLARDALEGNVSTVVTDVQLSFLGEGLTAVSFSHLLLLPISSHP